MDQWFNLALEEYKQLWEENRLGQENGVQILRIGFALIAALFGALLIPTTNPMFQSLILKWVIPFSCYTVLVLWLNELGRMVRAGNFLKLLEERFNALFADEDIMKSLLSSNRSEFFKEHLREDHMQYPSLWHTWLRSPHPTSGITPQGQLYGGYILMIALWSLAAGGAIYLSYYLADSSLMIEREGWDFRRYIIQIFKFHPLGLVIYIGMLSHTVFKAWRISRLN